MDILILFVVMIMCVLFGWNLRERYAIRKTQRLFDALQREVQESIEDLIYIKIEKHNDTLFVYDMKTSKFMAQGTSRSELEEILGKAFPGKRFAVSPENLKEVGFTL